MKRLLLPLTVGIAVIAAVYGIRWQIDAFHPSQRFMLPKPHEVLVASFTHRAQLIPATLSTLQGTVLGLACAIVISVLMGVVLSLSQAIRASLFPYLMILQMTPIIVVAPILQIWIGPGLTSVTIITFLISFFPLVVNTTQGLISTDRNLVELFKLSRATRWQEITHLRLPAALPYFFTGLRIAAVLAPIGAVVGDFFAGNSAGGVGGLGFMTVIYSANLDTPALFATAGICCALGFLLAGAVSLLSWLCLHKWHDSYAAAE